MIFFFTFGMIMQILRKVVAMMENRRTPKTFVLMEESFMRPEGLVLFSADGAFICFTKYPPFTSYCNIIAVCLFYCNKKQKIGKIVQ